ncbi:helix-hairpin-helix domain-containing protein [Gryllotalpicola koreensis]|uniref:Helix-hairpin-helix DNA-binding motif class 1 domain-containing protein n=1 Tax=Gryllotalpicola koreensis TaxID=993086 RepID=A0ABP7ZVX9_9MICO
MSDSEPDPGEVLADSARVGSRWRVGLGAAVVLLVLGVAVAVIAGLVSGGGGAQPIAELTPSPGVGVTPASPVPTAMASVVVHVLGQVKRPGVYELPDGARVIDAIGAAGGFAAGADQGGLNLAQVLTDGEQVAVPKPGQMPVASDPAGSAGGTTPAPGAKVDLNSATPEQLETLPRVGPAMAQRIIDWRTQNGRFASVDDLKNVSGIGDKTFEQLKDLVVVR